MNDITNKYIDKTFRAAAFNFVVYAITSISISISLVHIKNDLNFSLTQSASFSFISSVEQTLILLFTPVFASKYGKVKILKISLFILMVGVLCFSFSINYITALLSLLCMGLGTALQEALLTPIVGDLYPENVNAKMNVMHAFWPLGICGSLIFIGYLLSIGISWRWVYFSISLVAFLNFWFYPSSKKIAFNKTNFDMEAAKKIFKSSSFWFFWINPFLCWRSRRSFFFLVSNFYTDKFEHFCLCCRNYYSFFFTRNYDWAFFKCKTLKSNIYTKNDYYLSFFNTFCFFYFLFC